MDNVDFHVHSTYSDGLFSPKELYNIAKLNNVKYLAITDHDNLQANKVIYENKNIYNDVKFVSGIELSCVFMGVELHMSALGFDIFNENLNNRIKNVSDGRKNRMKNMIDFVLKNSSIKIPKEEIKKLLKIQNVGKPHLASVILKYNTFNDIEELYKNYLNKFKFADYKIPVEEAVKLVHDAGGLIFVAHPYKLIKHLKDTTVADFIKKLISTGVDGIEIYNRHQSPEVTKEYRALAKKLNIYTSGGSDFHGEIYSKTRLGFGTGNNCRFFKHDINVINWIQKNNKWLNI